MHIYISRDLGILQKSIGIQKTLMYKWQWLKILCKHYDQKQWKNRINTVTVLILKYTVVFRHDILARKNSYDCIMYETTLNIYSTYLSKDNIYMFIGTCSFMETRNHFFELQQNEFEHNA